MAKIGPKTFIANNTGKVLSNPVNNPAQYFTGECVSLVQQMLYQVHGIPYRPRGNGKDWATSLIREGIGKAITAKEARLGDIVVYDGQTGGGYGHVAMVVDVAKKHMFDQNNANRPVNNANVGRKTAQTRYMLGITPSAYIRVTVPAGKDHYDIEPEKYAFTPDANRNFRSTPDAAVAGNIVGVLEKGETFNYTGKIAINGFVWVTDGQKFVTVRTYKNGFRGEVFGKLHEQKETKPKYDITPETYAYIPNANRNLRSAPDASGEGNIVGVLTKGTQYNYTGKIAINGYVWVTDGKTFVAVRSWNGKDRGEVYGQLVPQKVALKKGDTVEVINNIQYTGGTFGAYRKTYTVMEQPKGDRVVIGYDNIVIAAVNEINLRKV